MAAEAAKATRERRPIVPLERNIMVCSYVLLLSIWMIPTISDNRKRKLILWLRLPACGYDSRRGVDIDRPSTQKLSLRESTSNCTSAPAAALFVNPLLRNKTGWRAPFSFKIKAVKVKPATRAVAARGSWLDVQCSFVTKPLASEPYFF